MNIEYLKNLLNARGCSGYESRVQEVFTSHISHFADKIKKDNLGNVIAILNPNAKYKILLEGHADEIGFIVTKIEDNGYIRFSEIGGLDKKVLPGTKVIVGRKNILGVIGKKAIHVEEKKDEDKVIEIEDLFIDIGAKNKVEVEEYISIGDTATFHNEVETLFNNLIASKSIDNRAGIFIITEVLKRLKGKTKLGIYALSATQEEVGYRGAIVGSYSINPDVGIAIDVTHSTDTPSSDTKGAEIKLGEGGVLCISPSTNVRVADLIKAAAKRNKIKMQVEASGCPMGTDTNVVQTTRSGVATALISVPLRYMHTQVETCSLDDLEATIDLIVATILGIEKGQSFLP